MKIPIYLRTYFSPFKPLKLKWYIGKTSVGVPYFYPRKWVKFTQRDAEEEALKSMEKHTRAKKSYEEWVEYYKRYRKPVPLKVGFSYCGLGWKTKWTHADYRFEFSPVWSFVFFGYQIALTFYAEEMHHYWECFLPYHYNTNKSSSAKERVAQCRKDFPCIWTSHSGEEKTTTDYYDLILKSKYV